MPVREQWRNLSTSFRTSLCCGSELAYSAERVVIGNVHKLRSYQDFAHLAVAECRKIEE